MADPAAYLVPLGGMLMTILIVVTALYFRNERFKAENDGGSKYRELAEEALRGQKALLDEVKRMNTSLREIERLLREV